LVLKDNLFKGNEHYLPKCNTPTVKHGGGNTMVWRCMSGIGVGGLHKIDGIMNKKKYHPILINHGVANRLCLIGTGFYHQEDNDLKHSLKLCRGYLVLIMMVWPTFNPRSKSY
jgi:hypothetical protein